MFSFSIIFSKKKKKWLEGKFPTIYLLLYLTKENLILQPPNEIFTKRTFLLLFFCDIFNLIFLAKIFHPDFYFYLFFVSNCLKFNEVGWKERKDTKYCLRHFDKKKGKSSIYRIKGISSIYHSDIYTMI